MLDPLELRRLLSSSLSGTILNITGTDSANVVEVSISSGKIKVAESGLAAKYYTQSSVSKIIAKLKGGNDKITVSSSVTKNCELQGGSGNDTLRGGGGTDALLGQDGNDNLEGGVKNDYLDGGKGQDTVDYSSRTTSITAQIIYEPGWLSPFPNTDDEYVWLGNGGQDGELDSFTWVEGLRGGSGGDKLAVHTYHDVLPAIQYLLEGRGGADQLNAYGEAAWNVPVAASPYQVVVMKGGDGNDVLGYHGYIGSKMYGENGNDTIGPNDDNENVPPSVVEGGDGTDFYHFSNASKTSEGVAQINMGIGLERLLVVCGEWGSATVDGNDLNNEITLWAANNVTVHGAGGNDKIVIAREQDDPTAGVQGAKLYGDSGNDTVLGGYQPDSIWGGDGNDSINGYEAADRLYGGGGNDTLSGGTGNDSLYGESGWDKLYGGSGNDYLKGDSGRDTLYGERGNDVLWARDSEVDYLYGGTGTDTADIDSGRTVKDIFSEVELFML